MLQKASKKFWIITAVSIALIVAVIAALFLINSTADQLDFITLVGDGTLTSGKYYVDGNTDSYYYEVFDDRTIQLGGVEPLDFVLSYNRDFIIEDPNDERYDEFWKFAKEEAEWAGARKDYLVINQNYPDGRSNPIIVFVKTIEEFEGGSFMYYVDEKTFRVFSHDFIRADTVIR